MHTSSSLIQKVSTSTAWTSNSQTSSAWIPQFQTSVWWVTQTPWASSSLDQHWATQPSTNRESTRCQIHLYTRLTLRRKSRSVCSRRSWRRFRSSSRLIRVIWNQTRSTLTWVNRISSKQSVATTSSQRNRPPQCRSPLEAAWLLRLLVTLWFPDHARTRLRNLTLQSSMWMMSHSTMT